MDISDIYSLYRQSYRVTTDTRTITENCLFFALKGPNFNGNKFASVALEKGADYAVIDESEYVTSSKMILVNDVLETLQQLANWHRRNLKAKIIAITGSNGKTTSKELIAAVLSKKYRTMATKGNLNNHIGVPLTLLSFTPGTEIGIVEMGANHLNEIAFLARIAQPDYGYVTNFGKAHLEGFGSIQGVIVAKSELYDYLRENDKPVFVNTDDPIQVAKTKEIKTISFGMNDAENDYCIRTVDSGLFVKVCFDGVEVRTNLVGTYNFSNIAIAIAIGSFFDVKGKAIKGALEAYIPDNNRSQLLKRGAVTIFLDAYNANPTSMRAALDDFLSFDARRKFVILGDMRELGEKSIEEHRHMADFVGTLPFEACYLVGESFSKVDISASTVFQYATVEDLKKTLIHGSYTDCAILIKGSRLMALEQLVEVFPGNKPS